MSKALLRRIIIIFIFCIVFLISMYFIINQTIKPNIELKNNKETIYSLFDKYVEKFK